MARCRNPLIQGVLASLTILFGQLTLLLPLSWSRKLALVLGRIAFLLIPRMRRVGMANLDLAYGDTLSAAEKKRILRGALDNLALTAAEFSRLPRVAKRRFEGYVEVTGFEHIDTTRGFLGISGHLGNWEWMCPAVASCGFQVAEVVRLFDQPWLNAVIDRTRRGGGIATIPKDNAGRAVLELLRKGWLMGLLIDQSPRQNGVPVTFFGQPCWATVAPVMIALRAKVPIHPVSMVRDERGRYTCRFHPAIEMVRSGDPLRDLVANSQRCQSALERIIREHPDQWLWFHRRWKKRERLEQEWQARQARQARKRRQEPGGEEEGDCMPEIGSLQ